MSDDVVLLDSTAEGVRRITPHRPDRLNTMNADLVAALHRALDEVAADRACRAVLLTGAGRAFCAGLDLTGYGDPEREERMDVPLATLDRQREIARLTQRPHDLPSR